MSNLFGGVDWVELHEPFNNQTVYISLATGVTSEKRPLNVDIKNAYDFEWWELLDGKSNRFYYFNTRSKQTTWIKPQSSSIIPFGNVQMNCKDKFQSPLSSMLNADLNTDFMKPQKTSHYGTTKRSADLKGVHKRSRSPLIQSLSSDNTSTTNVSMSPSIGQSEIQVDDLVDKIEGQCHINDINLQHDSLNDNPSGLSSTPSIKHRPFPRTNPRSVPRRVGGAESPVTHHQQSGLSNKNSGMPDSAEDGLCDNSDSVRRRPGYTDASNEDQLQVNTSESSVGDKPISSQQRCQSRSSLSSAGTESTMNTMGIMSAQGQAYRPGRNVTTELPGQIGSPNQEAAVNMNNGGSHQGMSLPNTMNGYPLYDYPPGPNTNYYMTHQNYMLMQQQQLQQQQQQGGISGRIASSSAVSQPEGFCLRRPQSEQAIGTDIRMTMVSPRSDIIPGIAQSNRYYPTTAGWVERSFSPLPFAQAVPQYSGPLPGWNSELFRKDQAPAKLLNWCKDSIQKPLLVSTDKILKSEACQAFKQIQGYMGDRKSKHSPTELVNSVIQKGANYYPLRDEVFMQICKQTTNNPDELSTLRGWELLQTCLNYFAPSGMFRPYLEGYVIRHLDTNHSNECPTPPKIQQAAEQTLHILSRQTSNVMRYDPTFHNYQYQQQQMVMMAANMQTVASSNPKNHVPMHLFESGDNSDDSNSQRCLPLSSHFGYSIDEIMRAQYIKFPDRELPWILVTLCDEIIRRNGERTEGIFRIQADSSMIQAMCTVLDLCENVAEHPLTVSDISPHTPACCLKRWLDSLLEPLVPPSLCTVSQGNRARSPLEIYQCLSRLHQATLMYLIRFLQLLSLDDNTRLNRMGPWNLAVALAPNVFQLDPGSSEYGGSRSSKRAGGSSGLDTCRSDNSANDSSGSSSRGGTASADDSFRPHVNFLYQLIVGLDTSPLLDVS